MKFRCHHKTRAAEFGGEETGWSKSITLKQDQTYEWVESSYSMDTYDYDRTTKTTQAFGNWSIQGDNYVLDGLQCNKKEWDCYNDYLSGNTYQGEVAGSKKENLPHHLTIPKYKLAHPLPPLKLDPLKSHEWYPFGAWRQEEIKQWVRRQQLEALISAGGTTKIASAQRVLQNEDLAKKVIKMLPASFDE